MTLVAASLVLGPLAISPAAAGAAVTPVSSPACGPVQYGGPGEPDALIVSDLPLQGDSHDRTVQMNDAIGIVLANAGWQAGSSKVGFQPCDDSLASTGLWDPAQCQSNGTAYANDPSVLAVIGTYNSGCARAMLPILNTAPGGGLAMVSPGNTFVCITETSRRCPDGEPGSLYPTGRRNYARVVPNDAYQMAGLANFAHSRHRERVYILYAADDPTSLGQARNFRGAARKLGIKIIGFRSWNPNARSYRRLMHTVARTHPDGVLLAGLIEEHGARLIKDKVAVLGANKGPVMLLAPDGFTQQSTIVLAGQAARGMFASLPGRVPQDLTGPGKQLVQQLQAMVGGPVQLYAPYAGQAASVVLGAIGQSGDRSGVISAVFATAVNNGITGSFRILPSGDPSAGPITVSVARRTFKPVHVVSPSQALVRAARNG